MNEIRALIKETTESSLVLSPSEDIAKIHKSYEPREEALTKMCWPLSLGLPAVPYRLQNVVVIVT